MRCPPGQPEEGLSALPVQPGEDPPGSCSLNRFGGLHTGPPSWGHTYPLAPVEKYDAGEVMADPPPRAAGGPFKHPPTEGRAPAPGRRPGRSTGSWGHGGSPNSLRLTR